MPILRGYAKIRRRNKKDVLKLPASEHPFSSVLKLRATFLFRRGILSAPSGFRFFYRDYPRLLKPLKFL
jgi:hypothetical protein